MSDYSRQFPKVLDLLTGHTGETFAFERLWQFGRFVGWVAAPQEKAVIELAGKVAVARGMHETLRGRNPDAVGEQGETLVSEAMAHHFPPKLVSTTLLSLPGLNDEELFWDQLADADLAAEVATFLLQLAEHPIERKKPSMNRAVHFVCNAGFDPDAKKLSHIKIRQAWNDHAASVPILVAARLTGWIDELEAPNDKRFWRFYHHNISGRALLGLLSTARVVQERLKQVVSPETLERIDLLEYPPSLGEGIFSLPDFDEAQKELIDRYEAPSVVGT